VNPRTACLTAGLLGLSAIQPAAQSPSAASWREFRTATLNIAFRHPATPGLRIEPRAATCAESDRNWTGGTPDSMLVVTRTAASLAQVAAYLGIVQQDGRWVAVGYEGTRAPVAAVHGGGWDALVATGALTVVYDMALRSPVSAPQWRFVAIGPAGDGCRPLLLALATRMAGGWDSTTVAAVLATARPRAP
jgi:hypothetical protein